MPRKTLSPDEMRLMRESLGLDRQQLADMLETTVFIVQRWERPVDRKSYNKPPHRVVRLMEAYLAGYRPDDWPVEAAA